MKFSERGNTCSITLKNSPDHLVYPQKFGVYNHALSSISLGSTGMPRRNWKRWLFKISGVNKVPCALCENGEQNRPIKWLPCFNLVPGLFLFPALPLSEGLWRYSARIEVILYRLSYSRQGCRQYLYLAIIEWDWVSRIWRIMQIEEGVIHQGRVKKDHKGTWSFMQRNWGKFQGKGPFSFYTGWVKGELSLSPA